MKSIMFLMIHAGLIGLAYYAFAVPFIYAVSRAPWPCELFGGALFLWQLSVLVLYILRDRQSHLLSRFYLTAGKIFIALMLLLCVLNAHILVNDVSSFAQQYAYQLSFFDGVSVLGIGICYWRLWVSNQWQHSQLIRSVNTVSVIFSPVILVSALNLWVPYFALTSVEQFAINHRLSQFVVLIFVLVIWWRARVVKRLDVYYKLLVVILMSQILGTELVGQGSVWRLLVDYFSTLPVFPALVLIGLIFSLPLFINEVRRVYKKQ